MEIKISKNKIASIQPGMMGLFFEDINYAADGGLYAEMIENRSFEFLEAFGDKGDYFTKFDGEYGWSLYPAGAVAEIEVVSGSPLYQENPHYLRLVSREAGAGFANKAYAGICLKKGWEYCVKFYARTVARVKKGANDISEDHKENELPVFRVQIVKDEEIYAQAEVKSVISKKSKPNHWEKYELTLTSDRDVTGAQFVLSMDLPGIAEFDFISMMPANAVAGIFRKDLFEKLAELKPGFIRFPGGCIVEGNTLDNRYLYKETLKIPEARKGNWNRWAVHGNKEENEFCSIYSHYNQTYGLGYFEYFLLCELLGAAPLPVMNVGMACQYQSWEWYDMDDEHFQEFIQDAIDLITFANGDVTTKWGAVRAALGHPEPFGLKMLGIGNEQWQTKESDFFSRYEAFEKAIHEIYPEIYLIGSAGPDVTSEHYTEAWNFYEKHEKEKNFVYAVDEHYYMKPNWFLEHTDFYDGYPRTRKVFSGEYAAHPEGGANTLEGALSEAAFLTGVERNADVVLLSSYAPLFGRHGFAQWKPDMIWFDEKQAYGTPSFYVQKMYSTNMGTVVLDPMGQEKELKEKGIYFNASLDETAGKIIIKIVNMSGDKLPLSFIKDGKKLEIVRVELLGGDGMEPDAQNSLEEPEKIKTQVLDKLDVLPDRAFAVYTCLS